MPNSATIRLKEGGAAWAELDGETVLLSLSELSYLGINRSGSLLWTALAEGATRQQLIDLLTARYGIAVEQAAADVEAFVAACLAHDLLDVT